MCQTRRMVQGFYLSPSGQRQVSTCEFLASQDSIMRKENVLSILAVFFSDKGSQKKLTW